MEIPHIVTRWNDYIDLQLLCLQQWIKQHKSWIAFGGFVIFLAAMLVSGYVYRDNVRSLLQKMLRIPPLAMLTVTPASHVSDDEIHVLEQRVDDLVKQYQADNTYRQQLTSDFQAATKVESANNDQLVKQGQQLSQAVQDVQAEVQSLANSGAEVPATSPTPDSSSQSATHSPPVAAKININTATIDELDTLPGIGASYAQAIITYRTQHGNFQTIQDIENVPGIGDATFKKLQDMIMV